MEIKHISVFSAGKVMGIICAAIGLIMGVLFLLFGSMLGGLAAASGGEGGGIMAIGGVMGVIALPILYGIFGFIGGVIQAFVYNLAAAWGGGIPIPTQEHPAARRGPHPGSRRATIAAWPMPP